MKKYDLMILGPAVRDENIDYTGAVDRSVGGVGYVLHARGACGEPKRVCRRKGCAGGCGYYGSVPDAEGGSHADSREKDDADAQ